MEIFIEISIILGLVTGISVVMKVLRQPLVVGYILAGIVAGPYVLDIVQAQESLDFFARVGITVLLFIVGLQLSPRIVKEIGGTSLITGLGQVLFTSVAGFVIIRALGFALVPALYLAVALTFSSTIIILKLLSDYGGINKLYGKLSIGFLLVQDLIASAILIIVGTLATATAAGGVEGALMVLAGKVLVIGGVLFGVQKIVIPPLSRFFATSQELLFLFSLSWGLGMAALFHAVGLSMEIGALLAGITLSVTPFAFEIGARMKPLRDYFLVLFFILLGSRMVVEQVAPLMTPALILSLFILVGNPLIVFLLMRGRGYHPRTALLSGFTVAQISEFSLILVSLGVDIGHVPTEVLSLATLVGLITIACSTYLIIYGEHIYTLLERGLVHVPGKRIRQNDGTVASHDSNVFVFGYDRMGQNLVAALSQLGARPLVVDYNPEAIERLTEKGIPARYGDAEDAEFLEELGLEQAIMCISTIPNLNINLLMTQKVRAKNKKAIVIAVSHNDHETKILYEHGATYVIMPDFLGAHYASEVIVRHGFDKNAFTAERAKHLRLLKNL